MKIKFLLATLMFAFLFSNCSIDKRLYRPGFHIEWRNHKTVPKQNQMNSVELESVFSAVEINDSKKIELKENNDERTISTKSKQVVESKSKKEEIQSKVIVDSCDLIVCKNGDEIDAKVLEIGLAEIKYKKCDNPTGPTISIKKSEVLMIKYPNGTKDIIKSSTSNDTKSSDDGGPKLNAFALTAMICGILALITYYGAIPLAILAIIFGTKAIKQIKANPENYKPSSLKMAKAGMICGIVGLGILAILLLI